MYNIGAANDLSLIKEDRTIIDSIFSRRPDFDGFKFRGFSKSTYSLVNFCFEFVNLYRQDLWSITSCSLMLLN
jgi:hypothetical protein